MMYLIPFITTFALTSLLLLGVIKLFPKIGLMDRPEKYGLKRKAIPYPAGIILLISFLITAPLFLTLDIKLIGLMLAAILLVIVSFIDDRMGLPPLMRLFVQILSGVILVIAGIGVAHITNPFGGQIQLDQLRFLFEINGQTISILAFSGLLTIIWVVLVTNTLNWLDGVPGMVSGITTIGSLTLFFLSITDFVNQPEVATLAIIITAMALAFWLFDFSPPKVLMGDSGSMLFGLLLASIAIFSGGKIATAFLILGFPIIDALYVIIYRLYNRRAPWKGGEWDKYRKAVHLHHRLLQFGFSERQVLIMVYILCALFGITALFVGTRGKFWAIVTALLLFIIVGFILKARKKS